MKVSIQDVSYVAGLVCNLFILTIAMSQGMHLSNEKKIIVLTKGGRKLEFYKFYKEIRGYMARINFKPTTIKSNNTTTNNILLNCNINDNNTQKLTAHRININELHQILRHPTRIHVMIMANKIGVTLTGEW